MKTSRTNNTWRWAAFLGLAALIAFGAQFAVAQEGAVPADPAADQAAEGADEAQVTDADPVVMRLGGTEVRLSEIEWRFDVAMRSFAAGQGVPYTEEIEAQLRGLLPSYLEQRGTEVVLLREAANRGLTPDDDAVQATLEQIRASVPADEYETALADAGFQSEENLLTIIREGDLITQVLAALREESQPSEEEIRVRYLADIGDYTQPETFCARHILVEEEVLATEIIERVQAGEDFAALAAEHGTDATASRGGDLGCFQRGMMVAPFEEAVVEATVDEVTGPVETQFGYHAVLLYEHRAQEVMPFDEVRESVAASIAADAASAAMEGLLRGSGLVTYPERLPAP